PVHQVRQSARASTSCVGDGHVGSQHLNAFVHHTLQHLLGLPLQALKRHLGTNEKRFYPLHHLVQTLRVSPAEHLHHGRQPSPAPTPSQDRKSTRLNSSHVKISYAVFCLKKKRYLSSSKKAAT